METIEQLRGRISSAEDLQSVVRTMKGLAAVNIRQYERAVESLQQYARTIEQGLQILLRRAARDVPLRQAFEPESESLAVTAAVIFGSDQGMVGQFNGRVMEYAFGAPRNADAPGGEAVVISIGRRLAGALEMAGHPVERTFALPRSVGAIADHVEQVVLTLQALRQKRGVGRIVLHHNVPLTGAAYRPESRQIYPLDPDWLAELSVTPWPCRGLPTHFSDWRTLLASVVQQQLFAALFRAFAESLAAENASRMASMQAAERNIEDRLGDLYQRYHQRRQTMITEELLDVMAGYEAVNKG